MTPGPVRILVPDVASCMGVVEEARVVEVRDTVAVVDLRGRRIAVGVRRLEQAAADAVRAAEWDAREKARAGRGP